MVAFPGFAEKMLCAGMRKKSRRKTIIDAATTIRPFFRMPLSMTTLFRICFV
jgi:hypothetical protein